jgi:superfamily II DNA or RNA helicase
MKKRFPQKKQPLVLTGDYKERVRQSSYLGKKGYTIKKESLSKEDIDFLHTDLFVKPETFGPKYGKPGEQDEVAFPVYKENEKKIYVPRFYGIQRYGLPDQSEISTGESITVDFVKPLRDYQDKIVDVYMKHIDTPISIKSENLGQGGILEVPCGRGKCLGKDTPILMYDGSVQPVQNIRAGDLLMGDDSTKRTVLSLARGMDMMYRVKTDTGEYIVNQSHILSLKFPNGEAPLDISVSDYLRLNQTDPSNGLKGYRVPIDFPETKTNSDPYYFAKTVKNHIPIEYKCNSREKRLSLLAGIIDAHGHLIYDRYEILHEQESMVNDIIYVARSLGFYSTKVLPDPFNIDSNFTIKIRGKISEIPVKNGEKSKPYLDYTPENPLTYQITIEKMDHDEYFGFEIDGNRRFVLGDFTVTHNTVMALKIISLLKKKTLIVVHKEFLMNQWIERAAEFIPSAKIGKIQGPVFDIEGKDVVIGMLQTLYDRNFPENAFDSFGLTIIDEVHRIGSEQFSKTLLRVITPNMLGISATVDRKDGLSRVLHMFIGDKIYSEERKEEDPVCVRAIEYNTLDPDFLETEYDFRGNVKHSTMISKLCAFGPRSDFVVKVLQDLIKENGEKQIMVLCHNRSLLTYLYTAILHRGFATTGYYVGGMKQADLQETELKQIVLATYAMAAEALDIKSLSTLVMVTPKTDIIQSVGRILRVKHENPIIVDIVDKHDSFQNQWKKRKTFYRKCNYRILSIDSVRYKGMEIDASWKTVYEPKTGNGEESEHKCLIQTDALEFIEEQP